MERPNSLGLLLDSASQLCSGSDYVQLRDISRLSSKCSNPLVFVGSSVLHEIMSHFETFSVWSSRCLNPLVGSLAFYIAAVCVHTHCPGCMKAKVVGVQTTMSNFKTFPDWSSKCSNPLVGLLAFLHCSSVCLYTLSWMEEGHRPLVDSRQRLRIHGCGTSEVPATWRWSTGEAAKAPLFCVCWRLPAYP